jgi:hypothetical protein
VALEAAGAEAGLDRVGRREQQRVGAAAVAVGDDRHGGWRARAVKQRAQVGARERGTVAGDQQRPRVGLLKGVRDADQSGVALAGLGVVLKDNRTAGARKRGDGGLVGDDDGVQSRCLDEHVEHVRDHCRSQPAALLRRELVVQARLGQFETLDREDRECAHQPLSASANSSVWPASRRRDTASCISVSHSSERSPSTAWSATMASSRGA